MNKTHILAIDAGTQSVRALLFDLQGNLTDKAQVMIDSYQSPQPGWVENDPEAFWRTLCQACQQLWERTSIARSAIAGVVVTTQRGTTIALDSSGKPLRSRLNGADLEAYDAAMAKIGMPKNGFDPFKPWAAGVTLQMMGLANSGYDPNSGVETQLTAAAKASGKPIIGVETMEGQLAIFDNLPEANQLRFLNESSAMADQLVGQMDGMVELWAKPDPDGLARLMNDGLSDPVILAELLTLRNARWAYWIKDRMQKPGTMFMAVGAGHLAGGASVQHLLGAYGLSVERIQY